MIHPPGAQPGYRRSPLSAEERARGEANLAPLVAQMLVARGRFRVSADTPDQVELFQGVARRVSDMLGRSVVSYANGREIVVTFGPGEAPALALRLLNSGDDAKRVPRGVGVDPQCLLRVIRAILEQPGAERERPLMLDVEVSQGGHRGVQVHLLRDRAVRPGCLGQLPDLLEGQRGAAGRARQIQPVLPGRVRLSGPRRLVARAVPQAEQLPVELGQAPRVGGVQDRLPDDRERLLIVHTVTVVTAAAPVRPRRC
jgi:hypothetical protein